MAAANPLPTTQKLIAADGAGGYEEAEAPIPPLEGVDILVHNEATSMNPVDYKVLGGAAKGRVLGYDSVGTVAAVGPRSTRFKVGDRVWFSGAIARAGTNASFTAVDERIVSLAPKSLSAADGAALPLVGLTAWEGLFEQLRLSAPASVGQSILVYPGGGGVGSIVIQLAKRVLNMTVVATASRPESSAYCKELGADHVINHREPLRPQLEALGLSGVNHIFNAYALNAATFNQFADIILPLGGIVDIVSFDASANLDLGKLFYKRAFFAFELMFQRTLNGDPADRIQQGKILQALAFLVDAGVVKSNKQKELKYSLETLREALALQKSGEALGKTVLVF
jgi:NADPH2:quinone reductase